MIETNWTNIIGRNAKRDHLFLRMMSKAIVNQASGCWEWQSAKDGGGYGILSKGWRKTPYKAHRLSYEFFVGRIPEGFVVRHKCDNPSCINPRHLETGTQKDNAKDASVRGRLNKKSLLNLHPGEKGFHGAGPKSNLEIKNGSRN